MASSWKPAARRRSPCVPLAWLVPACAALLLPACSRDDELLASHDPDEAPRAEAPIPGVLQSRSISVQPLSSEDIVKADLSGELACSFIGTPGEPPLFLGRANVGPNEGGQAVIRLPGGIQRLDMRKRGGFGQLSQGGMFQVLGMQVEITLTHDVPLPERPADARETTASAAMLDVRARTGQATVQGVYECGP